MSDNAAAGAARPRAVDLSRGTNQSGVRLYNERLVLSLIRRHASLPKAEIARLTGLSAQTITVIMRQLETDGLVIKQERQRGKIGQPSVPFALDREGAFSLGLKIGRRSSDLVLLDFAGRVRDAIHETHPYPIASEILDFVADGSERLTRGLTRRQRSRIAGLGIAAPFELWNWEEQINAPRYVLDHWRTFDAQNEIARICPWPVFFCNDATAACGAELILGNPAQHQDFLYFFIGSFIGGGVVLNGALYAGRTGNAGALGSMPIATSSPEGARVSQQLIRGASIYVLEHKLVAAGEDAAILWQSPDDWGVMDTIVEDWIAEVSENLAFAIVAAIAVIDFAAVVIDGAFPTSVRARIVARTNEKAALLDHQGLSPVTIAEGSIGSGARAIGGACLPLLANFARDREVLFKDSA
jgi:predicted NBD/HSP70 family sugar kinase/biotin operon repressor